MEDNEPDETRCTIWHRARMRAQLHDDCHKAKWIERERKGEEEPIESHYQSAIATSMVLLLRMNHSLSRQHSYSIGGDGGGKLICWPIVISQNVPLQPRDIIAFDRAAIQLHSSLFESIYSCPLRIESVKRVFVRPSFTTIDKGWAISLLFTACLNHLASQMKSAMQTTHTSA